jgi:hypothetical protein
VSLPINAPCPPFTLVDPPPLPPGTINITALGTAPAGAMRKINFSISSGTVTLIHSGNLGCPGGINLPITSGDWVEFRSNGGGSWTVAEHLFYQTFASASTTLTGTNTVQALTPAGFAGNKSLGTNGFYKLPGGLIIQWGSTGNQATGNTAVTLPTAFPSAAFSLTISGGTGGQVAPTFVSLSTSGFTAVNNDAALMNMFWIAIGN